MSVEVKIYQKGFFKRPLSLNTVIGADLSYGTCDEFFRLVPNKTDSEGFFAYLPDFPARGIFIKWNEKEMDSIELRLILPTVTEEASPSFL